MSAFYIFTTIVLIGILVYIVLYLIYSRKENSNIVTSNATNDNTSFDEGDFFYYLPTAAINITATATVAVSTGEDGIIVSADVYQLDLTLSVQYLADTSKRYKIKFNDSWFANDELAFRSNAEGLLESIDLSVEDRSSTIISQISDAPSKLKQTGIGPMNLLSANLDFQATEKLTVQVLPLFTRTIIWNSDNFNSPLKVDWKIAIPGQAFDPVCADASFKLDITNSFKKPADWRDTSPADFGGIISRPYKSLDINLHQADGKTSNKFNKNIAAKFSILIPDPNHLIGIPLKRAAFVKKTVMPKFFNGLLIENHLIKPSQAEALVSIPINIAKAIFSIPAQLLSFSINHLQQQSPQDTAQQKPLTVAHQVNKAQQTSNANALSTAATPTPQVQNVASDLMLGQTPPESAFRSLSLENSEMMLQDGQQRVVTPAGYRIIGAVTDNLQNSRALIGKSALMAPFDLVKLTADDSWKLDAEWQNTTGRPIITFRASWVVPKAPKNSDNPQVFFLFSGIQNEEHLLQCVLQWGKSHLGGDKKWMIGCCHAVSGGTFPDFSSLVDVTEGALLNATITCTPTGAGLGNYQLAFEGYDQTILPIGGLPLLPACCLTLESYMIQDTDDYPQSNIITFDKISLSTSARPIAPNWMPQAMSGDKGVFMKIVSSSQVDMYFRPTNNNNSTV